MRYVYRPEIQVSFIRKTGPYAKAAAEAWRELMGTISWREWLRFPREMIGICHDDPDITEEEKLRYDAGLRFRLKGTPAKGVSERRLRRGRFAEFLHVGSYESLPGTYARIYGAWLPDSGKRLAEDPAVEVYLDHPDRVPPESLRTLILLPLESDWKEG